MKRLVLAACPLVSLLLAFGCGGSGERRVAQKPPPLQPAAAARAPGCRPWSRMPLGNRGVTFAAVARRPTRTFRLPGRRPFASFGLRNVNGYWTVFGVLGAVVGADCRARWYRVELPLRPNGTTGYVPARDVTVVRVKTRIVVDLSRRLVTLYRAGRPVLRVRGAIGSPATPTPTGRFYVNQRLIAADPGGPWGPAAIGISAFSPAEQDWAQGGPIAIHGTNEPWTIGHAASHGCIRIRNRMLARLFRQTPAGTPVLIRS